MLHHCAAQVREAAQAFCEYLYTKEAQREFAACGFRCAGQGVAAYSSPLLHAPTGGALAGQLTPLCPLERVC